MMFFLILNFGWIAVALGAGIGTAWDVSPVQSTGYTTHSTWPRVDLSAFQVRSISGMGKAQSLKSKPVKKSENSKKSIMIKREAKEIEDMQNDYIPEIFFDNPFFKGIFKKSKPQHPDVEILPKSWKKSIEQDRISSNSPLCPESLEENINYREIIREIPRVRRAIEDVQLEKISTTKNIREPRLNAAPDSWSKQPLSIEFHHRTSLDGMPMPEDDDIFQSSMEARQTPKTEFITANKRSFLDTRETRDLPLNHNFDDLPYRNALKGRHSEIYYPRGYYYPDHLRTERDYLIRGVNDAMFSSDRYRIEDYDMYRNRPTPKPKRIIYYATLPEIIRKPIDLRRRPYDMERTTIPPPAIRNPIYKRLSGMIDPKYEYKSYPYGYNSYDPYIKRSSYWDHPYMPYYDKLDEDRYREQDLNHASFKEVPPRRISTDKGSALKFENSVEGRSQEKLPWPVQIETELSVKDNERISGRKIFGQHLDYERFQPSARIEREKNDKAPDEDGQSRN